MVDIRTILHDGLVQHECRHGTFVTLKSDTVIGSSLEHYGEWCESEVTSLTGLLRPGDVVIDAGANIGCHTIPFARAVGDEGRVYAIEAQPYMLQILAANATLNGLPNIRPITAALADEPGTIRLPEIDYSVPGNYGGLSLRGIEENLTGNVAVRVPKQALDDLLELPYLRLIKMDIERMEALALRGARKLIEKHRPILFIEIELAEDTDAIFAALDGLNYNGYWQISRYYSKDNWRNETSNFFGQSAGVNLLFLPEGMTVSGLHRAYGAADHPRAPRDQVDLLNT